MVTLRNKRIVKTEDALALWNADRGKKREFGHQSGQDKGQISLRSNLATGAIGSG